MGDGWPLDVALARSAMSKSLWRILPLILLAYLFAVMDRVNVSFAAVQMNDELKFSATIYGLGGGLFFLGYALFEVPSNLLLVRFGARRWIARIMITWGILAAGMMFVHTPLQFYVLRFLLGVAEAGFFPASSIISQAGSRWHGGGARSADSMSQALSQPSSWVAYRAGCLRSTERQDYAAGNGCS